MSNFLDKLNEKIRKSNFNDWSIDQIFLVYKSSEDDIENLIYKYHFNIIQAKSFKLEEEEVKTIRAVYNPKLNILIRSVLDFLLANSKDYYESKLERDCEEIIDLYFLNINVIKDWRPLHNMATIIKWTIQKFPSAKASVRNLFIKTISNDNSNNIQLFFAIIYFMREKELKNILNADDYYMIFNKYFVEESAKENIYLYLDFYKDYLEYIKLYDKDRKKEFLRKYIAYVFNSLDNIDYHIKQTLLQQVRDYMDEFGDFSDEKYKIIDNSLEKVNKEALNAMKAYHGYLPKEIHARITEKRQKQKDIYEKLDNCTRINKLMVDSIPLSLDELKKSYEANRNSLVSLVIGHYLDEEGRVINYKELNDSQKFSLKCGEWIKIRVGVSFDLYLNNFIITYKNDEESKNYIKSIISNNHLVLLDRIDYITSLFVEFFDRDYKHSVYNIVEELEESLRYYFKNQGMNILKKDGSHDFIGLTNIFNDFGKNTYRDKLLENIDDDFYFTLKWFLTDKYGFELRSKIAHRYKSNELYKTTYAIYSVIQIFRLYWGFQK